MLLSCSAADGLGLVSADDGTRPTLGNHNGGDLNQFMDVQGFSHKPASAFEAYHKTDAAKPLMASEVRFLTEILDDFRRFVDEIWRF